VSQTSEATTATVAPDQLRRELKLLDAAALSVGIIGPVGAMALLGVGTAGILGRAAPLAFIFAIIGVALVAYGFVRLSRYIAHAGSVYALAGVTLGPRAGFFAGWALFGAYLGIGAGSAIEVGLFGGEFLRGINVVDSKEWIAIALVGLAIIGLLAYNEVKIITRTLLTAEVTAVVLVTVLWLIVLVRLIVGDVPDHQSFTLDFLSLPKGSTLDTVATASVFGFLAFAGFEGAAALGEETNAPRRSIPRAIKIAVVVAASFYLLTIIAQTLGYGTDAAGVKAFRNASSPYGDLATMYVGSGLADVLNLAATISLIGIALACMAAASRVLYALGRDAVGPHSVIAHTSRRTGAPVVALAVCFLVYLGVMLGQRINGSDVLDATFYALTVGTLPLLVAYVMATLGAIRYLFLTPDRKAPTWEIIVPVAGVAVLGYTLYKNTFGLDFPYDRFPILVSIWLLVGLAVVLFSPGVTKRIGRGLGKSTEPAAERAPEPASEAPAPAASPTGR
jgi:amino acid transporter